MEFPWLDYPERGWRVPCPACGSKITNEFSAFKQHWRNADCQGPQAVSKKEWRELGIGSKEAESIRQSSEGGNERTGPGHTSNIKSNTNDAPGEFREIEGNTDDSFPFIGNNRERTRTECPSCGQRVDNTISSFINHWRESSSCKGAPPAVPPGVELEQDEWRQLISDIEPQDPPRTTSQAKTNNSSRDGRDTSPDRESSTEESPPTTNSGHGTSPNKESSAKRSPSTTRSRRDAAPNRESSTQLESLPTTSSGSIKKADAIEWIKDLAEPSDTNLQTSIVEKPSDFTGSTFPADISTIRLTGDPQFIETVAGLLSWIVEMEDYKRRVDIKLQETEDRESGEETGNYALYLSVVERG